MFVLCTCHIFAQKKVYVKISGKEAYYKVENSGKKAAYYSREFKNDEDLLSFEYFSYRCAKKEYEEVKAEEKELSSVVSSSPKSVSSSNDEQKLFDNKTVIARPKIKIKTSSNLAVYEKYNLFIVEQAEDKDLVGCEISCLVVERRKSNINGSEGRLSLRPLYINKKNGDIVRLLPTDIHKRGLNRANVKFWTSIFVVPVFIPGTGAKILSNEHFEFRIE